MTEGKEAMAAKEFRMKVLYGGQAYLRNCFPSHVMLPAECEEQAVKNHHQTLDELNSRGGLSPCELVAVMQCRKYQSMNVVELVDAFREYHWL